MCPTVKAHKADQRCSLLVGKNLDNAFDDRTSGEVVDIAEVNESAWSIAFCNTHK